MTTGLRELGTLVLAGMLLACSPQAAEQTGGNEAATTAAETHPQSGLAIVPVTVTTDSGSHIFRTEVAESAEAQRQGMMFRTDMAPDEAMIFPYASADIRSFWMRNTVLPLDIIFIDESGTIINIEDGVPYNEVSVLSERPAIAVLELAGGRAEELGIGPGDTVEW